MKTLRFAPRLLHTVSALACTASVGVAQAHDTWFEALSNVANASANAAAPHLLALGTGNQVPTHEFAVATSALARQGCVDGTGRSRDLQPQLQLPTRLVLRTTQGGAMSCWAQLVPFDIDLPADKIALYIEEIRPSAEVLAQWAAMQARGLAWRERYTKFARIELPGATGSTGATVAPAALPISPSLGLDLHLLTDASRVQAGDSLNFQLLRDGQPLPGLALELRSTVGTAGIWGVTDAAGQLRLTVSQAGAWVLRGTELRVAASDPTRWDSRFITLAFQVKP